MKLIWKLLHQHISIWQLTGFFLANLFGMFIILFAIGFYRDTLPLFDENSGILKNDYLFISKKISTLGTITGKKNSFSEREIDEIKHQSFINGVGDFQSSQFAVSAGIGMKSAGIYFGTEMFFESVPDEYVDVSLDQWHFDAASSIIPVVIPRNYLNLYNFGFAQARNLPKLSEGLMGMIQFDIYLKGNDHRETYKGNIVGFSNRLNTILVPEEFMNWANKEFAPDKKLEPSRLIIEVTNPADEAIAHFFQKKGYEVEGDKLDEGKASYFLKMIISIVMVVGLLITILSFYILLLSIYLLIQKNSSKLENLMLIGYSPSKIALPYQSLILGLNGAVLLISLLLVICLRNSYLAPIALIFPGLELAGQGGTVLVGIFLFIFVSVLNIFIIRRKMTSIWNGAT